MNIPLSHWPQLSWRSEIPVGFEHTVDSTYFVAEETLILLDNFCLPWNLVKHLKKLCL